jgi:hypothetical protein
MREVNRLSFDADGAQPTGAVDDHQIGARAGHDPATIVEAEILRR